MNYIIFDLECTCWENDKSKPHEIIEIGAVKLNDKLETIDEFNIFVKPVLYPKLTEFCTKLTTITQADVDNAKPFNESIRDFEKWMGEDVLLCSYGFFDKAHIIKEAKMKGYQGSIIKTCDKKHISVKHKFAEIKNTRPIGMGGALKMLHIPLEGTHHRGIDDARNIAKIFKAIFPKIQSSKLK